MRWVAAIVGVFVMTAVVKSVKKPSLKYFSPVEFGPWYPMMSSDLLIKLDRFRELWGYPVEVSNAQGAIGREDGSESQHNFLRWGEVRAIDVFPKIGSRYIESVQERQRAYEIARQVGFTGIGIYTDTRPGNMLHLDVREDRTPQAPAMWSRVNKQFGAITGVLV